MPGQLGRDIVTLFTVAGRADHAITFSLVFESKAMEYDKEKLDEMVLALMWLVLHGDRHEVRAWKSFDWDTLDRLHAKGLISDPKSKAKSVALSDKAVKLSEMLFKKHFGTPN
jgi:hypothetical protein